MTTEEIKIAEVELKLDDFKRWNNRTNCCGVGVHLGCDEDKMYIICNYKAKEYAYVCEPHLTQVDYSNWTILWNNN